MAKKVFNKQGGLHSDAAFTAFENRAWGSCVADIASFVATASAGMNISVSTGDGLIKIDNFNGRRIQTTTAEVVAVPAANSSFGRIDTLVAYIDTAVVATTAVVDNTNDMLKFMVVAGTAAATPVAPTAGAIQAAIGAGNPYMSLYNVLVPQGATNTAGATLTDLRKVVTTVDATMLKDGAVTAAKLAAGAATPDKVFGLYLDWLDSGQAGNVTITSSTYIDVTGIQTTVTNPYPVPLKFEVIMSMMMCANGGTYGGYIGLSVNNVDQTPRYATLIAGKWDSVTQSYMVTLPANSTVTLRGRGKTQAGGSISWGRDNTDTAFRTKLTGKVVGTA
jgi:hypothetical protein